MSQSHISFNNEKLAKYYRKECESETKAYNEALEGDMETIIPYLYSNSYYYRMLSYIFDGTGIDYENEEELIALLDSYKFSNYEERKAYLISKYGSLFTEDEINRILNFTPSKEDNAVFEYMNAFRNDSSSHLRRIASLLRLRKVS